MIYVAIFIILTNHKWNSKSETVIIPEMKNLKRSACESDL